MCSTSFVEIHDSVEVFEQLLPAAHSCLKEMISWTDIETSTKAHILLLSLEQCKFNVGSIVLKNIFHNFSTQSFYAYLFLQKPNIDLIQALEYVDNVVRQLHTVRNNADEEFSKCFDELQRK